MFTEDRVEFSNQGHGSTGAAGRAAGTQAHFISQFV